MELLWLDHKPFSGRASAFRTGCRWQAHTLNRSYINTHFTEQMRTRQPSENHTHILYFNTFPTAFNLEDVISWFLQIYHDLLKLLYLKSYDTAQTFNSAALKRCFSSPDHVRVSLLLLDHVQCFSLKKREKAVIVLLQTCIIVFLRWNTNNLFLCCWNELMLKRWEVCENWCLMPKILFVFQKQINYIWWKIQ